ncbi:MAG TPA: ABC transporter ATP-binding protein [Deltaproteobacteria bacterium]|nr:ABC transporter ATP-binding protein [Deltaproteobacteria bacterium]HPJ94141.1 ABC transporter ATP-binding protein [Deltaproteobacteria bacterium]HPR51522.1 ABC transporter ATP-binding protein [Deltaproteobacteria bacterium]
MITIDGLTKAYGPKIAISNVSFKVNRGEVLGFLGPNGAGKTTTMKIITSFMPPTSGHVSVMEYDTVKDSMKSRQCIGYLPENTPLYPDMRVKTFLKFVARAKGVKKVNMASRVNKVICEFGLEEVQNTVIATLSKGFRQRVGLAQALINDPPVLILDEPTIGLDPKQIYEIRQLIKDLSGSRTIILSSHILPEVSQLCDRVAIINKGKIVAIDRTQSLKARLQDHSSIIIKVGQRLEEALKIIEGVEGVLSVSSSNSSILNVETIKDRDLRPVMAEKIVGAGIPLLEIVRKEMSLEEIFMELITEEEGPDA